jgi:hypothetical protein
MNDPSLHAREKGPAGGDGPMAARKPSERYAAHDQSDQIARTKRHDTTIHPNYQICYGPYSNETPELRVVRFNTEVPAVTVVRGMASRPAASRGRTFFSQNPAQSEFSLKK